MPDREPPPFRLLADSDELEPADSDERMPLPQGLGRASKLIAGTLVVALLVSGGLVQWHRSNAARRQAQLAQSARGQLPVAPEPTDAGSANSSQPWPSASTGPCGGSGQLLPILATKPLTETTRVRLVVGSDGLRTVSLDDGTVSAAPRVMLRAGSLVTDTRTVGSTRYLVVNSCEGGLRSLRQAPGQLPTTAVGNLASSSLFGDAGNGVWVSTFSQGTTLAEAQLQVSLVRLDQPGRILLPANSFPVQFNGTLVVCQTVPLTGAGPQQLIVYDTVRHRISQYLGPVITLTSSQDRVVWTSVGCSAASSCPLHIYNGLTNRATVHSYALPVEAGVAGGVLSPDLSRLAFQLPRMIGDQRYRTGISGQPSDLVVLNLASGVLEPVPNLELPPGTSVGLSFSKDARWLVIGLTDARGPKLLVWRSGLNAALASAAQLPGPVPDPLPFQVIAD